MGRIKNYILKRLGILKLRDDYSKAKTEIDQLKQKNQYLIREKIEIEHRLYDLEKIEGNKSCNYAYFKELLLLRIKDIYPKYSEECNLQIQHEREKYYSTTKN